jgi:hypothetical protein
VAVGDGDFGSRGDGELEHGERGWGGGAVDEVTDGEAGETDLFGGSGHAVGHLGFQEWGWLILQEGDAVFVAEVRRGGG